jgi:hypothetical protein
MRFPSSVLALLVALPFAAACSDSGNGGAGGAPATTSTGSSKTVVKSKDAGPKDDAGADPESTSAGW